MGHLSSTISAAKVLAPAAKRKAAQPPPSGVNRTVYALASVESSGSSTEIGGAAGTASAGAVRSRRAAAHSEPDSPALALPLRAKDSSSLPRLGSLSWPEPGEEGGASASDAAGVTFWTAESDAATPVATAGVDPAVVAASAAAGPPPPPVPLQAVVLDCSRVTAIDGTGCRGLEGVRAAYGRAGILLLFAALPGPVRDTMQRNGIGKGADPPPPAASAASSSSASPRPAGGSAADTTPAVAPSPRAAVHSLETRYLSVAATVRALEDLLEDEARTGVISIAVPI
jgi:hypothetical protein